MTIENIKLELIDDNPYNPRTHYDADKIKDLAASIKEVGLRQVPEARRAGERYQLAYGHRRLRAFRTLNIVKDDKWATMPLDVKELTDQEIFQYALHENMNRSELKPLELARSIENYFIVFPEETEAALAKNLHMNQPTISNMRRVLKLPEKILKEIDNERINFTMARELLVLQGLHAKNAVNIEFNDVDLMHETINKTVAPGTLARSADAVSCTVEGIIKAIDLIASQYFKPLQKVNLDDVIFSASDEGCMRCDKCLTTHPQKTKSNHWCLNSECWEGKLKAYKTKLAEKYEEARKAANPVDQIDLFKNPVIAPKVENISPVTNNGPQNIYDAVAKTITPETPPVSTVTETAKNEPEQITPPSTAADIAIHEDLKKAEVTAMKEALEKTKELDKGRMMLILITQIKGFHIKDNAGPFTPLALFWHDIDPDNKVKVQDVEALFKKLEKLSEKDLAKLIVEFCLYALQYKGDVAKYTTSLTEYLGWMGVKIKTPEA
jgi:ParB/RepB/Spo0J family partition protein